MRVTFRIPTESDLDQLAQTMRPMDVKECDLILGLSPREALAECVGDAQWCSLAEVDGKPVCIFGLSQGSFLGEEAHPWMLCAEGIEAHARALLICAPRFLGEMLQSAETLSNVVHAHNRSAIRFLKWLGFSFGDEIAVKGEPFLHFEMRRAMAEAA